MKAKILSVLSVVMLVSSTALAVPVLDLTKGESVIGYNYVDLEPDSGPSYPVDEYYLETGLTDKFIVGLVQLSEREYHFKRIEFYGKYQIAPKVNIILGNLHYTSNGKNRISYGIDASTDFADKFTGYASVKDNEASTDWRVGTTYAVAEQVNLDLNYYWMRGADWTEKGLGLGINFKF